MKQKCIQLCRFETIITILIITAFSLAWISWGKLIVSGWDLPNLNKKVTSLSNAILFFTKKESPHLAYVLYISPALSLFSVLFLLRKKYRAANIFLLGGCIIGFSASIYMYYYLFSSKIFKLSNAGVGIHILCIVSLIGILYSSTYCFRKRNNEKDNLTTTAINSNEPENTNSEY